PEEISLIDIIQSVEDKYQLTECMIEKHDNENCSHLDCCKIRNPLMEIQFKIDNLFQQTTLKQIL
ncbi:MAG: Rrf2 family transcriptional regulator, partial [Ignavibacteria bacterium]